MLINLDNPEIYDEPFRHVIFRNCVNVDFQEVLEQADMLFSENEGKLVQTENYSKVEVKKANGVCGELLKFMSGEVLLRVCEKYLNMQGLSTDPDYDGGGLTYSAPGKFLRYHYDFPYSNTTKKYRVVNALLYLSNPCIRGGQLQLLDPKSGTVEASIEPTFGTLAMFPTSSETPHGVSKIKDHNRISINSYFYADQPLDDRLEPSKTIWLNEVKGVRH